MPDSSTIPTLPVTTRTVGAPIPGDMAPVTVTDAARTILASDAERLIKMAKADGTSAYNLVTGTILGLGRSVRVLRFTAAVVNIAWPAGVTVNGVAGAGSVSIANSYKSAVVTQLAASEYLIEGAI